MKKPKEMTEMTKTAETGETTTKIDSPPPEFSGEDRESEKNDRNDDRPANDALARGIFLHATNSRRTLDLLLRDMTVKSIFRALGNPFPNPDSDPDSKPVSGAVRGIIRPRPAGRGRAGKSPNRSGSMARGAFFLIALALGLFFLPTPDADAQNSRGPENAPGVAAAPAVRGDAGLADSPGEAKVPTSPNAATSPNARTRSGPPAASAAGEPEELKKLKNLSAPRGREAEAGGKTRDDAQSEAAYLVSIQAGTNGGYREILEKRVKPMEKKLDALFDFESLAGRKGELYLIPPVVTKAGKAVKMRGNISATAQAGSFRMVRKAEMSPGVPDWREYLYPELPDPEETHPALLPATAKEKALWAKRVERGWETGLREAAELFETRWNALVRDHKGMILYLRLSEGGLVRNPEVLVRGTPKETRDIEIVYSLTDYELIDRGSFLAPPEPEKKGNPGKTKK